MSPLKCILTISTSTQIITLLRLEYGRQVWGEFDGVAVEAEGSTGQ